MRHDVPMPMFKRYIRLRLPLRQIQHICRIGKPTISDLRSEMRLRYNNSTSPQQRVGNAARDGTGLDERVRLYLTHLCNVSAPQGTWIYLYKYSFT